MAKKIKIVMFEKELIDFQRGLRRLIKQIERG